jgi:hypothetical protein
MSLIAMDSLQFHQFAEGLGIDVLRRHDKTAVVIFSVTVSYAFISLHLQYGVLQTVHMSVCMRVCPKVTRLAAWSDNCKWYSSLPLGAVL